ncbi:MAG: hypothetical protein IPN71_13705 [Fibrobacteres bacterium]|nr:hypothetical protein [Fibrobacterota bacterium]
MNRTRMLWRLIGALAVVGFCWLGGDLLVRPTWNHLRDKQQSLDSLRLRLGNVESFQEPAKTETVDAVAWLRAEAAKSGVVLEDAATVASSDGLLISLKGQAEFAQMAPWVHRFSQLDSPCLLSKWAMRTKDPRGGRFTFELSATCQEGRP